MGFNEKEVLLNSFAYSKFDYCLFGIFVHLNLYVKSKKIQEWALKLLNNDFVSDYAEFLKKSGKDTMKIKRLRCLAQEIFKTENKLNPS